MRKEVVQGVIAGGVALALFGVYRVWASNQCPTGEIHAEIQAQVRAQLKSPSSAIFPPFDELARPLGNSECAFVISGDIEAQNSFGAMVRTPISGDAVKTSDGIDVRVSPVGD